MKQYLVTGALALVLGGCLTSCSENEDLFGSVVDAKLQAYEEVFQKEFGTVSPQQDWGFGKASQLARTRAMMGLMAARTRATMPSKPTFSSKPSKPSTPSFSETVPSTATYVGDIGNNSWTDGMTVYVDASNSYVDQNKSNLTVYVDGTVTYTSGVNQNGNGQTFVVTRNSTLVLKAFGLQEKIYLAPGATLDLREYKNWENKVAYSFEKNSVIYLGSGSKVLAGDLTFFDGVTVINEGGTITADYLKIDKKSTLWNEGTITANDSLSLDNENVTVYNALGKTVTVGRLKLTNNSDLFYNEGTITASDSISLQNTDAEIVNTGTVNAMALGFAAGGKYHNVGTTTITKDTRVTNSNSKWLNEGTYTSGNFVIDNYAKQVWNNCRLTVTGNFYQNRGEFELDEGASVVTNTFTWENTSNFWMNSQSLLSVAGELHTNNYDNEWGFRGVGSDYAVIKAGSIAHDGNEQFRMCYYGNLYVDTPSHFEQWYKDGPSNNQQPAYYYDSTVKLSFLGDSSPVTIPSGTCTPGYGGGSSVIPDTGEIPLNQGETYTETTTVTYYDVRTLNDAGRIICEDLGTISSSDIDFNDIVFDAYIYDNTRWKHTVVKRDDTGVVQSEYWEKDNSVAVTTTTDVYLLAGGGTLPVTVAGQTFKSLFGAGTGTIVNTIDESAGSYGNPYTDCNYATIKGIEGIETLNDIPVIVFYSGNQFAKITAEQGKVPHKLCVPIPTPWPYERINIGNAFDGFSDYVKNRTTGETDWTKRTPIYIRNTAGDTIGIYQDYSTNECWTIDYSNSEKYKNLLYMKAVAGSKSSSNVITLPYADEARVFATDSQVSSRRFPAGALTEISSSSTVQYYTTGGYQQGETVLSRKRN